MSKPSLQGNLVKIVMVESRARTFEHIVQTFNERIVIRCRQKSAEIMTEMRVLNFTREVLPNKPT